MRTSGELVLRVCMLLLGQDVLREKEHHIEQLLKERELERSEITRIASGHADQVEGKLKILRQEYDQYRTECETKFHEHLSLLAQLEKDRSGLTVQLDDERKKIEDIQFSFEEESISKADFEAANKKQQSQIQALEESLQFARRKNEKLEEELDIMNAQHLDRKKRSAENEVDVNELREKLKKVSFALSEKEKQLNEKEDLTASCQEKDAIIARLRTDLNTANGLLKEKHIGNEMQAMKELQRVEMQLSAKSFDLEHSLENAKRLEGEVIDLQRRLEVSNSALKSNCKIIESADEEKWRKEAETLRKSVGQASEEIFKVRKECALQIADKEMEIHELKVNLNYEILDAERLNTELNKTMVELSLNSESGKIRHTRQIENREMFITEISSNLEMITEELSTCQSLTMHLETEICSKNDKIHKLQMEMSSYAETFSQQQIYINQLIEEVKGAQMASGEWERKYQLAEDTTRQLTKMKLELEMQVKSILESSEDSNRQLSILNEEIRKTQAAMESLRLEMNMKLEAASRTEAELRFTVQKSTEQFNMERIRLEEQLKAAEDIEMTLKARCDKSMSEAMQLQEEMRAKITELKQMVDAGKLEINKIQEQSNEVIIKYEEQLQLSNSNKQQITQEFMFKIEQMTKEINQLKDIVKEKSEQLIVAEENLNKHLVESTLLSNQDKLAFEQKINNLVIEIGNYKKTIEESNIMIEKITLELHELKNAQFQFEQKIHEQEQHITQLSETNMKCNQAYSEFKNGVAHSEEQIKHLNDQIQILTAEKLNVEKNLQETHVQFTAVTNEIHQLQLQVTNINNLVQTKEQHIEAMKNEMQQLNAHKESMNSVLVERENKIVTLMSQLETVQKERGTHTEIFANQERQILDLKMEVQRLTQEKTEINNFIVQKEQNIAQLSQKLEETTNHANQAVQEKEKEINIVNQQLEVMHQEKENIVQTLKQNEQSLIVLNNNVQELQTEKLILENTAKEHQQNFVKVEEELRKTGDCKAASETVVHEYEHKILEKEKTIEILNQEVTKLRDEWAQPINNPVVNQIVQQLQEKEKVLEQKESQIVVLTNEVKSVIQQKDSVQLSWQSAAQEWKEKFVEIEKVKQDATKRCDNLQQQMVGLSEQAQNVQRVEIELQQQKHKYEEIYAQLTASEEQKHNLVNKLELMVQTPQIQAECKPIVQIVKEIQQVPTIQTEQFEQQIEENKITFHKALEESRVQLIEKERELGVQRSECASLQKQLLQMETRVVEVPVPGPVQIQVVERCSHQGQDQVKPITVHDNKQLNIPPTQHTDVAKPTEYFTLHRQFTNIPVAPSQQVPETPTQIVHNNVASPVAVAVASAGAMAAIPNRPLSPIQQYNEQIYPQPVQMQPTYYQPQQVYHPYVQQQGRGTEPHIIQPQQQQNVFVQPEMQSTYQVAPKEYYPVRQPNIYYGIQQSNQQQEQQMHAQIQTNHNPYIQTVPQHANQIISNAAVNQGMNHFIPNVVVPNQVGAQAQAYAGANSMIPNAGGAVQVSSACSADSFQQMMYEKSMAVGQVEFLNSIIVDMQRKNEELRARIEVLETGCHYNNAQAGASVGVDIDFGSAHKLIPPRQYCDICEVFDAHETEDCPIQVTDAEVDRIIHTLQPQARPYCEICEAFGHETAQCDGNETY